MVDYPAALPLPDTDWAGPQDSGVIETEVPAQLVNTAKTFNAPRREVSITFSMDNDTYVAWNLWVRDNGYKWFNMPIVSPAPSTGILTTQVVRFISDVDYRKVGDNWLSVTVTIEILPQQTNLELPPQPADQNPFFVTAMTVGQSGVTSNNNGFERMFDTHGSADPESVDSKGWTYIRTLRFDAGSNDFGISVGFQDPGAGTPVAIPNNDESWTFFEIENQPGRPTYTVIYLRTDFPEYSPLSGPLVEGTAWLARPGFNFNFDLSETYDVRFFDLPLQVFTLVGAAVGDITGYIKDVQGSLTPDQTVLGRDVYGLWFDDADNSWSFALVDPNHVLPQEHFGAIHMKDGSGNLVPSNQVSQKPLDATFTRENDGATNYTRWKWSNAGGDFTALTVWVSGLPTS